MFQVLEMRQRNGDGLSHWHVFPDEDDGRGVVEVLFHHGEKMRFSAQGGLTSEAVSQVPRRLHEFREGWDG